MKVKLCDYFSLLKTSLCIDLYIIILVNLYFLFFNFWYINLVLWYCFHYNRETLIFSKNLINYKF